MLKILFFCSPLRDQDLLNSNALVKKTKSCLVSAWHAEPLFKQRSASSKVARLLLLDTTQHLRNIPTLVGRRSGTNTATLYMSDLSSPDHDHERAKKK